MIKTKERFELETKNSKIIYIKEEVRNGLLSSISNLFNIIKAFIFKFFILSFQNK